MAEALAQEPELSVEQVSLKELGGGRAAVTARLLYREEPLTVRVEVV